MFVYSKLHLNKVVCIACFAREIRNNPRELLDELAAIEVEIAEEVEALRAALAKRID